MMHKNAAHNIFFFPMRQINGGNKDASWIQEKISEWVLTIDV